MTKNDQIYDITDFINLHPGGADVLFKHKNEDLARIMTGTENGYHRHSKAAFRILEKYRVGVDNYHPRTEMQTTETDTGSDTFTRKRDHLAKRDERKQELLQSSTSSSACVDWKKPMLEQVGQLGDKYFEWVHEPEEHHIRLFHSDFCEFFSMAPWWVVPIIWVPVMCLGMYQAYQNIYANSHIVQFPFIEQDIEIKPHYLPFVYVAGMVQWTLLEYLIHRWLFHLRPFTNSPFFIRMHFILHGQHHKAPLDKTRLVFPPVPASVFAYFIYHVLLKIYPLAVAQALFSGSVMGYTVYDLIHYYLHHGTPAIAYFRQLKHYHMLHHYVHQHIGFGISSTFWDYPFKTLINMEDN
ncbi:uncharacterized protein LOC106880340 [Argonauta hians]